MLKGKAKKVIEEFENKINKNVNKPCKITIENKGDEGVYLDFNGERMAIVVTLAGAVRKILDELDVPDNIFSILYENAQTGDHKE